MKVLFRSSLVSAAPHRRSLAHAAPLATYIGANGFLPTSTAANVSAPALISPRADFTAVPVGYGFASSQATNAGLAVSLGQYFDLQIAAS